MVDWSCFFLYIYVYILRSICIQDPVYAAGLLRDTYRYLFRPWDLFRKYGTARLSCVRVRHDWCLTLQEVAFSFVIRVLPGTSWILDPGG